MECVFAAPELYAADFPASATSSRPDQAHLDRSLDRHLASRLGMEMLEQGALILSSTSSDLSHLSPSASSTASSSQSTSQCRCVIDISTPATLERDFYAWLQGTDLHSSRSTPCIFQSASGVDFEFLESLSPGTSNCSDNPTLEGGQKQRARRKRNVDKGRGTNLYGRPYCPGRPLSMDERCQIIQLHQAGMKVNAISKQLCISHGCVSKIITR